MVKNASLKKSTSPQVIIEKLARNRISEEEAERVLAQKWVRAYDTPTVVRFIRELVRPWTTRRRLVR